ncbi:5-oxoprolinase subunit B family protein [Sediminihabitans luteus]|uniref:5-oxoprolinase subunit B family protein n=1 Tax=Sediminihabitans luteus TaxID=1138585 RepID=UPI001EF1CB70|nr:carboxyltransferase domain-containing protein [Sediminihabitans luteus]
MGRAALLVELDDLAGAQAFHAEVERRRADGRVVVRDVVPAARTVLLDGFATPDAARRVAADAPGWSVPPLVADDGPLVTLRVRFDGPDLDDVARCWDVAPADVVARLTTTELRVAFGGFAPGFGYLAGLPDELAVPRRATPRTVVPAGAVALAGTWAGVYPRESPGGWQIVGTAVDAALWDVDRDPPALLVPGTRVRFEDDA